MVNEKLNEFRLQLKICIRRLVAEKAENLVPTSSLRAAVFRASFRGDLALLHTITQKPLRSGLKISHKISSSFAKNKTNSINTSGILTSGKPKQWESESRSEEWSFVNCQIPISGCFHLKNAISEINSQNLSLKRKLKFESFKSSQFSPTLFGERVFVELTIQIKKNALQFVPVRSSRIRAPIQGPQCLATWSPEWGKIVNFRRPSKQCEKQVLVNSVYWASGGWLIQRRVHRRCSITCQC